MGTVSSTGTYNVEVLIDGKKVRGSPGGQGLADPNSPDKGNLKKSPGKSRRALSQQKDVLLDPKLADDSFTNASGGDAPKAPTPAAMARRKAILPTNVSLSGLSPSKKAESNAPPPKKAENNAPPPKKAESSAPAPEASQEEGT